MKKNHCQFAEHIENDMHNILSKTNLVEKIIVRSPATAIGIGTVTTWCQNWLPNQIKPMVKTKQKSEYFLINKIIESIYYLNISKFEL
jgi:metal-sulfur cluster biosynthetic enzyme